MLDYKIYPSLDLGDAEDKVRKVAGEQIAAWKGKTEVEVGRGKKKGKGIKLDFCEDLIRCVLGYDGSCSSSRLTRHYCPPSSYHHSALPCHGSVSPTSPECCLSNEHFHLALP